MKRPRTILGQRPRAVAFGALSVGAVVLGTLTGGGAAWGGPGTSEEPAGLHSAVTSSPVRSVADVVFPPGLSFSRAELLRWMDLQPRTRRHEGEFSQSSWRADLQRLELFYQQEGFDAASVTGIVEKRGDASVVLHLGIDEGPRWKWIRTSIEVHPERGTLRDSLAVLVPAPGEPASWRLLPLLRERLLGALSERGHHDASVEFLVRRDVPDRNAELRVVVWAGPRIRAEGLRIEGLDKTREEVVRREILVRDGQVLLPRDLRRSETRLRTLGVFEDVVVEPAPRSHRPGFRAVHVRVVEAEGGRFGGGFGYGSIDRFHVGASVEQSNLAGKAVRVQLAGVLGQERRRLEAGGFVPWFLGPRVGLRLSTSYEKLFPSRYEIERMGGEIAAVREIDELWKLEIGYVAERVRVLSAETPEERRSLRVGKLGVGLSRDSRDRLIGPTRGSYFRLSHDWVSPRLGSSEDFTRLKLQLRGHAHLALGFLGHAHALFGLLRNHDSGEDLPLSERFFAGGTEDLRGFPRDGIGPHDGNGLPVGGRILFLTGAELEHRVFDGIGLAGFVDLGQLENHEEDLRMRRLSVSAGGGLRWRSRLGYARADIGFPLTERFADSPRFHFGTGTTFF